MTYTSYIFRQAADGSSMFFEAICQTTRCPNPDHILYIHQYENLNLKNLNTQVTKELCFGSGKLD